MRVVAPGGWGIVSKQVLRNPSISPQAKGLYALLASYADYRTRRCHVGRERLAEDLGVSVRSVSIWIKELREADALDRQVRGFNQSQQTRLHDFVVIQMEAS